MLKPRRAAGLRNGMRTALAAGGWYRESIGALFDDANRGCEERRHARR